MTTRSTPAPSPIQRWATGTVAPAKRLDLYAEALNSAVDPMHVTSRRRGDFDAEVRSGGNEAVSVVMARAGAHDCVRDEREIAASGERCFHLIINTSSSWRLTHRGQVVLRPMDAVVLDSYLPHLIELPEFAITHLRMSSTWLRQWLETPDVLVGRVLPHDEGWCRALTAFAAQLTPELIVEPPLPGQMLADHVAVALALAANELAPRRKNVPTAERALRGKLGEVIRQRCIEHGLVAEDVARDGAVSVRTLHRCLAAGGQTFEQILLDARLDRAMEMLSHSAFDALSVAEIGRRSGFSDASHFGRLMRLRRGVTPGAYRRDRRRQSHLGEDLEG